MNGPLPINKTFLSETPHHDHVKYVIIANAKCHVHHFRLGFDSFYSDSDHNIISNEYKCVGKV